MAATKVDGSQTSVISTEHTLATISDPGVYQLAVDLTELAANDIVELRIYGKARTGDTERVIFRSTYGPIAVPAPLIVSTPIVSPHYLKATLKQTQGSARAYPWAVYEV